MTDPNLSGHALMRALTEQPSLSLQFYSYGMTLRKREGDVVSEYPVDPAQAASALAARITFTTGLLSADTLYVWQEGPVRVVAEYRKPQLTGVFLEGSADAVRVPLPGLVLVRITRGQAAPDYRLYAVKRRPRTLEGPLYHAPIPNVFNSGGICWGTVTRVSDAALADTALTADWAQLLGTPFGSHAAGGKSKAHRDDVRKQLLALEAAGKKRYPTSDLIAAKRTLADALAVRV